MSKLRVGKGKAYVFSINYQLPHVLRMLILFSIVLPAVLVSVAASKHWAQLHRSMEQRVTETASVLREHALNVFQTNELVLDRLTERTAPMDWEEIEGSHDVLVSMRGIATGLEYVSSLRLIRPNGQLSVNSIKYPLSTPIDVSDRKYFSGARNTDGSFVDGPLLDRLSNDTIIILGRRRSASDGRFDGLLAVTTSIDAFSDFYETFRRDEADSMALVLSRRGILASAPTAGNDAGKAEWPQDIEPPSAETGLYSVKSDVDGATRIYAYARVDPYPMYISVGASLGPLRRTWASDVITYASFGGTATLILVGLTALALRQARRTDAAIAKWQAEAGARERIEGHYRTLYDKAPVPQQSLDGDQRLLNVSDRWVDLLGFDRDAVIGRPFTQFLAHDQWSRFDKQWNRLVVDGAVSDVQLELVHQSGRRIPVLWSAVAERDKSGALTKTLGAFIDVTERRAAERDLARIQRVETVGQLTAGICHDFNNLLQAVSGCFQLLGKRVSDARSKEILKAGAQAVDRGAKLTGSLMAFARKDPLTPEAVNVPAQIRGMAELLVRALRDDIKLTLELPESVWPALADPIKLEAAILNVAVNARDAMPSGGMLSIKAANATLSPSDQIDGLLGEFVRLDLTDSGSGMPQEVLERAFDPFFTTKPVGKGTGLGLSQVYGFARQSGGSARITSVMGQGTTITLFLPRTDLNAPAPTIDLVEHAGLDGIRVVLVEDDTLVRDMTGSVLEELGCNVMRVSTSTEALELLRNGASVDFLLSDVVMPGMGGVELAKIASSLRPHLKIILTTGYSDHASDEQIATVLVKPYDLRGLVQAIVKATG